MMQRIGMAHMHVPLLSLLLLLLMAAAPARAGLSGFTLWFGPATSESSVTAQITFQRTTRTYDIATVNQATAGKIQYQGVFEPAGAGYLACTLNGDSPETTSGGDYSTLTSALLYSPTPNVLACTTSAEEDSGMEWTFSFQRANPNYALSNVELVSGSTIIEWAKAFAPSVAIPFHGDIYGYTTLTPLMPAVTSVRLRVTALDGTELQYLFGEGFFQTLTITNGVAKVEITLEPYTTTVVMLRDVERDVIYSFDVQRPAPSITSLVILDSDNAELPFPADPTQATAAFVAATHSYLNFDVGRAQYIVVYGKWNEGDSLEYSLDGSTQVTLQPQSDRAIDLVGPGPFSLILYSGSATSGDSTYTFELFRGIGLVEWTNVVTDEPLASNVFAPTTPTITVRIPASDAFVMRVTYTVPTGDTIMLQPDATCVGCPAAFDVTPDYPYEIEVKGDGPFTLELVYLSGGVALRTWTYVLKRPGPISEVRFADELDNELILEPDFDPDVVSYTVNLATTQSISVSATVLSAMEIEFDGLTSTLGEDAVWLATPTPATPESKVLTIHAPDDIDYVFTLVRQPANDISAVSISPLTLPFTFVAGTHSYAGSIDSTTSTLTVTAIYEVEFAVSVKAIAEQQTISTATMLRIGQPTDIQIPTNHTSFTIIVASLFSGEYSFALARAQSSVQPSIVLSFGDFGSGQLDPPFAYSTSTYSVQVPPGATLVNLTATFSSGDVTATMTDRLQATLTSGATIAFSLAPLDQSSLTLTLASSLGATYTIVFKLPCRVTTLTLTGASTLFDGALTADSSASLDVAAAQTLMLQSTIIGAYGSADAVLFIEDAIAQSQTLEASHDYTFNITTAEVPQTMRLAITSTSGQSIQFTLTRSASDISSLVLSPLADGQSIVWPASSRLFTGTLAAAAKSVSLTLTFTVAGSVAAWVESTEQSASTQLVSDTASFFTLPSSGELTLVVHSLQSGTYRFALTRETLPISEIVLTKVGSSHLPANNFPTDINEYYSFLTFYSVALDGFQTGIDVSVAFSGASEVVSAEFTGFDPVILTSGVATTMPFPNDQSTFTLDITSSINGVYTFLLTRPFSITGVEFFTANNQSLAFTTTFDTEKFDYTLEPCDAAIHLQANSQWPQYTQFAYSADNLSIIPFAANTRIAVVLPTSAAAFTILVGSPNLSAEVYYKFALTINPTLDTASSSTAEPAPDSSTGVEGESGAGSTGAGDSAGDGSTGSVSDSGSTGSDSTGTDSTGLGVLDSTGGASGVADPKPLDSIQLLQLSSTLLPSVIFPTPTNPFLRSKNNYGTNLDATQAMIGIAVNFVNANEVVVVTIDGNATSSQPLTANVAAWFALTGTSPTFIVRVVSNINGEYTFNLRRPAQVESIRFRDADGASIDTRPSFNNATYAYNITAELSPLLLEVQSILPLWTQVSAYWNDAAIAVAVNSVTSLDITGSGRLDIYVGRVGASTTTRYSFNIRFDPIDIQILNPLTSLAFPLYFNRSVTSYQVDIPYDLTYFRFAAHFGVGSNVTATFGSEAPRVLLSDQLFSHALAFDDASSVLSVTVDTGVSVRVYSFSFVRGASDVTAILFTNCQTYANFTIAPTFYPITKTYTLYLPASIDCLRVLASFVTDGSVSVSSNSDTEGRTLVAGRPATLTLDQTTTVVYVDSSLNGRFIFDLSFQSAVGVQDVRFYNAADNAELSVQPTFDPEQRTYAVTIPAALIDFKYRVVYLAPDQVDITIGSQANLTIASGVTLAAAFDPIPGSIIIRSQNVGLYTFFVTRQPVSGDVFDTTSLAVAIAGSAAPLPLAFQPTVHLYELTLPYNISSVQITALFTTYGGVTFYSTQFTTPQPLVSGVASSAIFIATGLTTITYTNAADSQGAYSICITRELPPKYARVDCYARAPLVQSLCAGSDFDANVYGVTCTSECANGASATGGGYFRFFEECLMPIVYTSTTTIGAYESRQLYSTCQVNRPVAFFYPAPSTCAEQQSAVFAACGLPNGYESIVAPATCSLICAYSWQAIATTCFNYLPTNHARYEAIKSMTTACNTANPLSLTAVTPALVASSVTTLGLIQVVWSSSRFDQLGLRVDLWTVESCADRACTDTRTACTTTGTDLTCATAGWTPYQQVFFRMRATNAVSHSPWSAVILATAQGKPIPAPAITCGDAGLTSLTVTVVSAAVTSSSPATVGFRAFLFPDTDSINSYQVANDPLVAFGGEGGIPVTGTLTVKDGFIASRTVDAAAIGDGITFTQVASNVTYAIFVQATSATFPGLVSTGLRCRTGAPIASSHVASVSPSLVGSSVSVSPYVIDATAASRIFFRCLAVGFSAAIRGGRVSFLYTPYAASSSTSTITFAIVAQDGTTTLKSGAVSSDLYGAYSIAANTAPFNVPGKLELTAVVIYDLAGNTLDVSTRADLVSLGVDAAQSAVYNNFIQYPADQQCTARQATVTATCNIQMPSRFNSGVCASTECATIYEPFYNECLLNAVFPPSSSLTSDSAAAARALFVSCQSFKPLNQYYPSGSSCSVDEVSLLARCGLSDISTYPVGAVCSAICATAYVEFSFRCLVNVPAASPTLTAQRTFLASCNANTPSAPKAAPQITATPASGGQIINARWVVPTGANEVTGLQSTFILNVSSDAGQTWRVAYRGVNTAFALSGLTPSSAYLLNVIAFNAIGFGPASANLFVTTRSSAPAAPIELVLNSGSISTSSASIAWNAPLTSETPVAGYFPCIGENGACGITGSMLPLTATSYTFTGLTQRTAYSVSVFSAAASGDLSVKSASVSFTTPAVAPPVPPAPTVRELTPSTITINMLAGFEQIKTTSALESTLRQTNGLGTPITISTPISGNTSYATQVFTVKFTGLNSATAYTVSVVAYASCTGLRSASSSVLSFVTKGVAPSAVISPTVSSVHSSGFTLAWSQPASNGGAPVTYAVKIYSIVDNFMTPSTVDVIGTSYVATKMRAGCTYSVKVVAVNSYGASPELTLPLINLPFGSPVIYGLIAANGGSLSADFVVRSKILVQFDVRVDSSALATLDQTKWFTFTPTMTCPFTCNWTQPVDGAGSTLDITFTGATGCTEPIIGTTTIALRQAANFISTSSAGLQSSASTSVSPVLIGRWSDSSRFVSSLADSFTQFQGDVVELSKFFVFHEAFRSVTASVSVRVTATVGAISTAAAAFEGTASAYSDASGTLTIDDFTAGEVSTIKVTISQAGQLIDQASTNVRITAKNHPIVLTAPATLDLPPSTETSQVKKQINGLALEDADTNNIPLAGAAIYMKASGPLGLLNLQSIPASLTDLTVYPSVGTDTAAIYLSGPVVQLNALLQANTLYASFGVNTGVDPSIIAIYVDDRNNGGAAGSTDNSFTLSRITVNVNCELAPAPVMVSAQLANEQNGFNLTFDSSVILPSSTSGVYDCLRIFDDATIAVLGGSNARCVMKSDRSFAISFGCGNTVSTRTVLTLRSNTVGACLSSRTFAAGSITGFTAATNPVPPSVRLSTTATIAPCAVATIRAVRTSDVLQSPLMLWSISASDGSSIDVSGTHGDTLTVQPDQLQAGMTYTVSAKFTNAFGAASSTGAVTFSVSSAGVASVRVSGARTRTIVRGTVPDLYPLIVNVELPSCVAPVDRPLSFVWSASPPLDAVLVVDGSKLLLSLSALTDNVPYTFTLVASAKHATATPVSTSLLLTVVPAALIVLPTMGPSRQVSTSDSMTQQVEVFDPSKTTDTIVYRWTCVEATGPECMAAGAPLTAPNAPSWTIGAGVLKSDSYVISVVVSKGDRVAEPVRFPVTIVPTLPPIVNVECPRYAIATNSELTISSTVTRRNSTSTITYAWNTYAEGTGKLTQPAFTQSTAYFRLNSEKVAFWQAGLAYRVTLLVTETLGRTSESTSLSCPIAIKSIPTGGSFSVAPTSGVAFSTIFTLTASQWQTSSTGDLSYSFHRVAGDRLVPISPVMQESSYSVQLPTVPVGSASHTIVCVVTDSSGASARQELTVSVTAGTISIEQLSETLAIDLADAVNRGDADGAINAIANIASTANAVSSSVGLSASRVVDLTALMRLNAQLVAALRAYYSRASPSQLLGALGEIGSMATAISPATAAAMATMLNMVFLTVTNAAQNDLTGINTAATSSGSASSLLPDEVLLASKLLATLLSASFQSSSNTSSTRRLLASSDSTTLVSSDRSAVGATYLSIRQMLTMQSEIALTTPGSTWQSTSGNTIEGIQRFRTSDTVTITFPSLVDGTLTMKSTLIADGSVVIRDVRYIVSQPNPFTWAESSDVLVADSSAITVELTYTSGLLLHDTAVSLTPDSSYSYVITQKYSLTACPAASCSPVCKLFDPKSLMWTILDVVTIVSDATATVTCASSTMGTIGLIVGRSKSQILADADRNNQDAPVQQWPASSSSLSTGMVIGISASLACLVVGLLAFVGWYFYHRTHPSKKVLAVEVQLSSIRSSAWTTPEEIGGPSKTDRQMRKLQQKQARARRASLDSTDSLVVTHL